ncbi:MAG: hypothetical protein WCL32_13900 [Planctomycetota bacterium]
MPIPELMSYDEHQNRWVKWYRKSRYTISAGVLGGNGKTDTVKAANEWWSAKRAEIDGKDAPGSTSAKLKFLEDFVGEPITDNTDAALAMSAFMEHYRDKRIPSEVLDAILTPERHASLKASANRLLDSVAAPAGESSIKEHFRQWADVQFAANKSAARKKMNVHMLKFFVDWIGESTPISEINETTWKSYWHHLAATSHDSGYKRRIQATARMFLEYLAEQNLIELPRNIGSKLLTFKNSPKTIKPKDVPTIKKLLGVAKGQLRLHVLLGLNCGMLPKDISELRHDMVDWTAGTITRKRTKLADCATAPTVTYQLWDETFSLLKEHRSQNADYVLVTKSGKPWVINEIESKIGGKYRNSNSIASCFRNAVAKVNGLKISPKDLRTTAATLLADHPTFKFYALHFLADSPKGTANKNYVVPSQSEFDDAIKWLGGKLG